MNTSRLVGAGLVALALVTVLIIGALLFYYRPSIEFAYVDTLDGREKAISGWWLLAGASALGALVGGVVAVVRHRREKIAKSAKRGHTPQTTELAPALR